MLMGNILRFEFILKINICTICKRKIIEEWNVPNWNEPFCGDCAIKQFDNEQKKALKT